MRTNFEPQNLFAKLDGVIVSQAISDLMRINDRNCSLAAQYFFLDGNGIDEENPKTFTALCLRNGLDPERAAKAIWAQLSEDQQKRISRLLKEAGCSISIN